MDYTMPETIAYRLSKMRPRRKWGFNDERGLPYGECVFCERVSPFGEHLAHDPECLWLNARQYIELRENAPVASQEPADSPIESRVDELLSAAEIEAAHRAIPTWRLI